MADTDKPDPANVRELFSQSCQMLRQFVLLHYYTYSVGAAVTAGLITLFFQKGALTHGGGMIIKVCGVLLLIIIPSIDAFVSHRVWVFYSLMGAYAERLDPRGEFGLKANSGWLSIWFPTLAIAALCAAGSVAWIWFAELPAEVNKVVQPT